MDLPSGRSAGARLVGRRRIACRCLQLPPHHSGEDACDLARTSCRSLRYENGEYPDAGGAGGRHAGHARGPGGRNALHGQSALKAPAEVLDVTAPYEEGRRDEGGIRPSGLPAIPPVTSTKPPPFRNELSPTSGGRPAM